MVSAKDAGAFETPRPYFWGSQHVIRYLCVIPMVESPRLAQKQKVISFYLDLDSYSDVSPLQLYEVVRMYSGTLVSSFVNHGSPGNTVSLSGEDLDAKGASRKQLSTKAWRTLWRRDPWSAQKACSAIQCLQSCGWAPTTSCSSLDFEKLEQPPCE